MIYRDPSMGCLSFGRISTVRNMNPHKVRQHKRSDLRKGTLRVFTTPLSLFFSHTQSMDDHLQVLAFTKKFASPIKVYHAFPHFLDRQDVESKF